MFIEETILSVLNQTYQNIEYIIVDGKSTDNTMEIVEKYRDRINIIISEKDGGQSNAINKGFKLATGQLVGWLNSDDLISPDCVEIVVERFKRGSNIALVQPQLANFIDEKSHVTCQRKIQANTLNEILHTNYAIIQPGSFYRRDLVEKIGWINESLHYCMDLDLILRLLQFGNIASVETAISSFRIWENSKTSTGNVKFLDEIKQTILKHGGTVFSRNIIVKYYVYKYKFYVKQALLSIGIEI